MKYIIDISILYVEDNYGIVEVIKQLLRAPIYAKVDFTHVNTLGGALKLLKCNMYDIILLDLNLQDSKGLDTLLRIMDNTDTPVIVITGEVDLLGREEAIANGARECLTKPYITRETLWRAIRYVWTQQLHDKEIKDTLHEIRSTRKYIDKALDQTKKMVNNIKMKDSCRD